MLKKLTLVLTDLVTLYGALGAALAIRYGLVAWPEQWADHTLPFGILFISWLLVIYVFNLYDHRFLRNDRDFFGRLFQAIITASVLSVLFFYLIPYFGITPKTNLVIFIGLFVTLAVPIRMAVNRVLAEGRKKRVLIIGLTEDSVALAQYLTTNPQLGWEVGGLLDIGQSALGQEQLNWSWPVLTTDSDLNLVLGQYKIDTVVISPSAYSLEHLVDNLFGALNSQVDFVSLAFFIEKLTGTVPLGAIDQQWFLTNTAEGSKKPYETIKRIIDLVAGSIMGLVALALTPVIALLIWLESPGPVIFRQKRTGRGGQPFEIIKFRTMHLDAEKHSGAVWAKVNDPRVTKVGRLLRRSRIDELPQLWNVLRGQMSLVGPRAERPEFDQDLVGRIPFYRERYLIKPGLSGWAQINYPYGSSVADASKKLEYDLYYLKNRSLFLDLEILLKSASIALRRMGR